MKILFLGPPCAKIELALKMHGHEIIRTEEKISYRYISNELFDFGISYRYRHIIKEDEIKFFCGRLINLPVAYLPWGKGADPNLWSWIENTPKGVTIHQIDSGCDTGDILLQKMVDINIIHETLASSYNKLSEEIENLFVENLELFFGSMITPKKQVGCGTYHMKKDKDIYADLFNKKKWDTPLSEVVSWAYDGK